MAMDRFLGILNRDMTILSTDIPDGHPSFNNKEILGRNWLEFVDPQCAEIAKSCFTDVLENGSGCFLVPEVRSNLFWHIRAIANKDTGIIACAEVAVPGEITSLTPREREVLWAIGSSGSIKAAAFNLDASHNTIRTHVRSINSKMGFESNDDMFLFADDISGLMGIDMLPSAPACMTCHLLNKVDGHNDCRSLIGLVTGGGMCEQDARSYEMAREGYVNSGELMDLALTAAAGLSIRDHMG